MDWVGISAVVTVVVAVLTWLDFTPNGPHIVAKIKEHLGERRRKRREFEELVHGNAETLARVVTLVEKLTNRIESLETDAGDLKKALEDVYHQEWVNSQFNQRLTSLEDDLKEVKSFQDDVVVDWIATLPVRVAALEVKALPDRVAELEAGVAELSSGFVFDRSPTLKRIRQAAKDREKGPA